LPDLTGERLRQLLAPHFSVESVGAGPEAARGAWELIEADGGQDVLGFGTVADHGWHLARLRDPSVMDRLAPDHSPAWRGLAVSILHVLALDHLIGPALNAQ